MAPNFIVRCLLVLACVFDWRNFGRGHLIQFDGQGWAIKIYDEQEPANVRS